MVKFHDINTHVPTCCLIEDYQMLYRAKKEGDWETVACAMECLAETIRNYTEVPDGLAIEPSECSLIAMGCANGIILNENKDVLCANGHPASDAGDTSHCNSECPYWGRCKTGEGQILLEGQIPYVFDDGDYDFLDALDEFYEEGEEQDV